MTVPVAEPIAARHGGADAKPQALQGALSLGLGVFGVGLINTAVLNTFPFLAGGLIDGRGMSATEAGLLISAELLVSALVALALSRPSLNLAPRSLGLAGCCLFAVGGLMAANAGGHALIAARLLAGAGEGVALAAGGRALAMAPSPARLSARVAVALAVFGTMLALGAGLVVAAGGYSRGCFYLAAVGMLGAGLSLFIPRTHGRRTSADPSGEPKAYNWPAAIPIIGAAGLMFLSAGAIWNFSERIGLQAGLTPAAVAATIAFTSLAGVVGGAVAVAMARLGRDFLVVGAGAVVFGGSVATLALATGPLQYAAALSVLSFAFVFVGPFILSIAVRIDASGGLAGAAQGAQMLAGAVAPFIGGLLLSKVSFRALAVLAAVTSALSVASLIAAHRRSPRPTGRAGTAEPSR